MSETRYLFIFSDKVVATVLGFRGICPCDNCQDELSAWPRPASCVFKGPASASSSLNSSKSKLSKTNSGSSCRNEKPRGSYVHISDGVFMLDSISILEISNYLALW